MLGRLVHKADFERLLGGRSRMRSAHFSLHHVHARPVAPAKPRQQRQAAELSTIVGQLSSQAVEELPDSIWYGSVVPKRHAKRAVTRNLIKRQVREAFGRYHTQLPRGLWMVRLLGGFAAAQFASASSDALARAARDELHSLLARAARLAEGS